ncbi:hypothetical protein SUGI_0312620 [Cryptomeria japonica]|uniref:WUSCHEL-related homeobox 4-like n=1 Tax=Cryptomeria japonica TaxID=3369 RepID=UPI00240899B4|nr:WUSCHEL-related homeobox 4-like [Cryptomeria japonica]GLJ17872.1 hypothetical protein SUGI_0312620 [Cryptomeria japonica]
MGPGLYRSSSVVDSSSRSRLSRSTSVTEATGIAKVASRWKPTAQQKQILESIYNNGTRNPSLEYVNEITIQLRQYGKVEGKNVFYWFQNYQAREKRKKESGSKWPAMFRSKKWTEFFSSKKSSKTEDEEDEGEEVSSDPRRNSSMAASDVRTLELFPLRPDRGSSQASRQ